MKATSTYNICRLLITHFFHGTVKIILTKFHMSNRMHKMAIPSQSPASTLH